MDKIDSQYPDGFNRINERHPDAAPDKPRKIIHNRHGLIYEVRIGIANILELIFVLHLISLELHL